MVKKKVAKKAETTSDATGEKPHAWVSYSPEEVEALIVKLAKSGNLPSRIGVILRDQYGVPDVSLVLKKKIEKVLEEKGVRGEVPEDLLSLLKRAVALHRHLSENRKDFHSKRGIEITESKINGLVKYYKGTGRLPQGWEYNLETAKLLVK